MELILSLILGSSIEISLNSPTVGFVGGIAVDSSGALYITRKVADCVELVTTTGSLGQCRYNPL